MTQIDCAIFPLRSLGILQCVCISLVRHYLLVCSYFFLIFCTIYAIVLSTASLFFFQQTTHICILCFAGSCRCYLLVFRRFIAVLPTISMLQRLWFPMFLYFALYFECLLAFNVLMSDFMASLFGNLFPLVAASVHFSCCFVLPARFLSCLFVTFMHFWIDRPLYFPIVPPIIPPCTPHSSLATWCILSPSRI